MDRILAIVPVHNRREASLSCLDGLNGIDRDTFQLDTAVIDDGSTDGTSEAVSARYPQVKILPGDGNLWWGGALNVGFRYALANGYDYLFALNDDIELKHDTLLELYRAAKAYPMAICGAVALRHDGRILECGFLFDRISGQIKNPFAGKLYQSLDWEVWSCETHCTRATLIPIEMLKRGVFVNDEKFIHNYSDLDLFDNARRAGFKILTVKKSVIVSDPSTSHFHALLLKLSIGALFSSFTNIRYAHNLRTMWNVAARHTNSFTAVMRFVLQMKGYAVFTLLRIVLPRQALVWVLTTTGRIEPGLDMAKKI